MAANFEIEINSKDKSAKGAKSAQANLEGLGAASKKVSGIMKAAFAGVSVAAIIKGTDKLLDLYGEQEKVEMRLKQAVGNNPYLNGDAAERMTEYASALQKTSTFGDEAIIQQQSMLASMNLTEGQINNVTQAAINLASSGMMSLESATRNLAKSYSGMAGELGESIPALRELSAEQLKAGEGIEIIKKQYAGMGEQMTKTTDGIRTQFKNMLGDLGEIAGGVLAPAFSGLLEDLMPVLESLGEWLNSNRTFIINFFSNIPELAKLAFTTVASLLSTIFSLDFLKSLGSALWEFFLEAGQNALKTIGALLSAIKDSIWKPLQYGWESMIYTIKSGFASFVDWFIEKINFVQAAGQKVGLFRKAEPLALLAEGLGDAPEFDADGLKDAWINVAETFKNSIVEIKEAGKVLGGSIADPLKAVMSDAIPEFKAILTKPVAEGGIGGAGTTGPGAGGGIPAWASTFNGPGSGTSPGIAGGGLGDIFGSIGSVLEQVGGAFMNMLTSLSSVQAIMNPLSTVLGAMFDVIAPAIDGVLAPLLGFLLVLGTTIGEALLPILEALMPVVEILAQGLVWFYNTIIVPVGTLLYQAVAIVMNLIIGVVNGITSAINAIFGTAIVQAGYIDAAAVGLKQISYEKVKATGTSAVSDGGDYGYNTEATSGGAAAQYTAGRTINQTVNVYADAIAGPGGLRQLAVMIRDEIYAAEALGA